MSSDWANSERESIRKTSAHNTGQMSQPSDLEEYGIQLISKIIDGSQDINDEIVREISDQIVKSGQPLNDAWEEFYPLIFSAAMSTSDDQSQKNLASLVLAIAHYKDRQPSTSEDETDTSKIGDLFSNLTGFGWMARDYWNGPKILIPAYGSHEASQKAWVNLSRFMAHLSCEQRKNPAEPLQKWVEDFGLWTITDGLEDQEGVKEWAEAAAVWLLIAGRDIYKDPSWGRRDGNQSPGIPLREGPLWSDRLTNEVTQESRWEFWKSRLQDLTVQDLSVTAKSAVREALEAMKRYESSS
ncbi:hypothetical protein F5Y02DRAFT_401948 [Annulohypoxylon stygium]|nr:hypothetical protein F5Y02DRAFT_401948 [Annulohypoxylon stygium]